MPDESAAAEDTAQQTTAAAAPRAVDLTDALGRQVHLEPPRRVAALIGSFADVWATAGGGKSLVAAAHDTWESFDLDLPAETADLGAVKEPNLELLLEAEPDLVLASANTAADIALLPTLEKAGIPVAYFEVDNFDDYREMLRVCTALTGRADLDARYGGEVERQVNEALARRPQGQEAPRVLYVRASGSGCKAKGSEGSVLGEMLADFGCENVADGSGLLENVSLEAIMEAEPDYIFAVLQGADKEAAQRTLEQTLLKNPAWASLRAVREEHFYTMDYRLYNLKPNARWGEAYEGLADILYGE